MLLQLLVEGEGRRNGRSGFEDNLPRGFAFYPHVFSLALSVTPPLLSFPHIVSHPSPSVLPPSLVLTCVPPQRHVHPSVVLAHSRPRTEDDARACLRVCVCAWKGVGVGECL